MLSVLYDKQNQCIWLARLGISLLSRDKFSVMQWPYVI